MTAPLLDSQLTEERCDGAMDAERHTGCVLKTELFGWKWTDRSPSGVRITLCICIYSYIFGQIRVKSSLSSLTQTFTHQISLSHPSNLTYTHTTSHMTVSCSRAAVSVVGAVWSPAALHWLHKPDKNFKLMLQDILSDENILEMYAKRKSLGLNWEKLRLTHLHVLVFVLEVHEPMVGSDSLTELAQVYTHSDEILPDLPSLIITLERFLKGAERLLPATHTQNRKISVFSRTTVNRSCLWMCCSIKQYMAKQKVVLCSPFQKLIWKTCS